MVTPTSLPAIRGSCFGRLLTDGEDEDANLLLDKVEAFPTGFFPEVGMDEGLAAAFVLPALGVLEEDLPPATGAVEGLVGVLVALGILDAGLEVEEGFVLIAEAVGILLEVFAPLPPTGREVV